MPSWRKFLSIAVSLFFLCAVAFAQRDLGTVTGTITDAQGAAVPSAKLTLTEDATGVSYNIQSNASGSFTRPALKAGTYTITVEAPGFQKSQQKNILINPGEPRSYRCGAPSANGNAYYRRDAEYCASHSVAPGRPADLHILSALVSRCSSSRAGRSRFAERRFFSQWRPFQR